MSLTLSTLEKTFGNREGRTVMKKQIEKEIENIREEPAAYQPVYRQSS